MRFAEIFATQQKPVISFEVYPPRTKKARASLENVLPRLVALKPTFMTVTYGAMGTTRERTLEVVSMIRREYGLDAATHLTCVGSTRDQIDALLRKAAEDGIENVVALRGDPPEGKGPFVAVEGGFAHANELVAHIREHHDFGIAVAGYPEKHHEAPDMDTDLSYLKRKVDTGADLVITQLFFQNADFFSFAERTRELGIRVPVVPGLLPIHSYQQIKRISEMCGAKIPEALRAELEEADGDAERVREIGARWCAEQCRGLLESDVPGIHFYVLNRAGHMERIFNELRTAGLLG